jgi:hypothetical protein
MKSLFRYVSVVLLLCVLVVPAYSQSSRCEGGLGGQFFSSGIPLEVEIFPAEADFVNEVYLFSPGPARLIGTNRETGKVVRLGVFSPGTELVFGIFVRDTGLTFKMGPGSLNPDGIAHAVVTCLDNLTANVGFEDKVNSDDIDYDDAVFQVRPASTDVSIERRPPFDFNEGCNATNEVGNSNAVVTSNFQTGFLSVNVMATGIGTATGRAGSGIVYSPNYTGPIRITAEVRLRRNSFDLLHLIPIPIRFVSQFAAASIDSSIFLRAQTTTSGPVIGSNPFRSKTIDNVNPFANPLDFFELNRYADAPTIAVELNTSVVAGQPLLICAGVQSRAGSISITPGRLLLSASKGLYDADLLKIKVEPQ